MDKLNNEFAAGRILHAAELNDVVNKVNELVDNANTAKPGSGGTPDDGSVTTAKLADDVKGLIGGKFGDMRIVTDSNNNSKLLMFSSKDDANTYDADATAGAALIIAQISLPAGGGSDSASTYYLRCVNNLAGNIISTTKDDDCQIDFTFVSKIKYPGDTDYADTGERGLVQISVKNAENSSYTVKAQFYVNANTETRYSISSMLTNGANSVMVKITGEQTEHTSPAISYNVQLTTMSLSAPNFAWYTPFTSDIVVPFMVAGNVSKSLVVTIEGTGYSTGYTQALGTDVYTTTALNYTISKPAADGVYKITAYLQNSDGSVKTKALIWNIIAVSSTSQVKLMVINKIKDEATNWAENQLFHYTMFNGGSATADAVFRIKMGDKEIYKSDNSEIGTSADNIFSYPMELDVADTTFDITVQIKDESGVTLHDDMTFRVDNSVGYSATAGAVFYLNPKTRSNAESNKTKIINAIDNSEITGTWTGMNWGNDGWTADADGNKLLRLMSGSTLDMAYQPLAIECAKTGKTIEIDYRVDNVTDYSTPVIIIGGSEVGIRIYPDNIYPKSVMLKNADNQSIPTDDGVRQKVTITILPDLYGNSGFNVCMIYVNGKRNRTFRYENNDYWAAAGDIVIGSDNADVDIYGIRIYNSGLGYDAVLKNYINWLPGTDEKATVTARNDVYNTLHTELDFAKIRKDKNVFVFDKAFPNYTNKAGVTGTLEVYFANETATRKNFAITNVAMSGQGTSSKHYYEWNEKCAIGSTSIITYSDGTTGTGSVLMFDGVPKCSKMTAKKNWASSMQDHKAGSVNAWNDLKNYMGLKNEAQEANSEVRTAVYQEPFIAFCKSVNEEGESVYTCMGEFTFGPDKGDKGTFGYNTTTYPDLICVEGSDNAPLHTLFRMPWNADVVYNSAEEAFQYNGTNCWDFDGGKADNIKNVIPAFNFVYTNSQMILPYDGTLDELNAAVATYKNTGYEYWIAKKGDANEYNLYYYDELTGKFQPSDIGDGVINLKTQLAGQTFTYNDGDTTVVSTLTESDLTGKTNDAINDLFKTARVARFGAAIGNYFALDELLFMIVFLHYFCAGTDNRTKNIYFDKFKAAGLIHAKTDDTDTIFPIENEGRLHKPYWVEIHDIDSTGKPYWNGETSQLFNLLELAYPNKIKAMAHSMLDAMISLGGMKTGTSREKIYAFYDKYYLGVKRYFAESVVNEDQKRYDLAELAMINGTYSSDVDPLSQSLGDLYSCEVSWVKKRIEYLMSKFSYGEYSASGTDNIIFRAAGDTINYQLTPAIKMYPTIVNGTSVVRGERTEAGTACNIAIQLSGTGDQQNIIEGASYLMDIGDWHTLQVSDAMTICGKMLKQIVLGNDDASTIVIAITSLNLSGCVALRKLYVTNIKTLAGTLDLSSLTHLQEVYAGGTSLAQIKLPQGGGLNHVTFPDSNKYLMLRNFPVLTMDGLLMNDCAGNIIDLYVLDCPNLDAIKLLTIIMDAQASQEAHSLLHVRISGFDDTYDTGGSSILDKLTALTNGTYAGLSVDGVAGTDYPKPILQGTLNINANVYEDSITSLKEYFGSLLVINFTGKYYLRFEDPAVQAICASNWGDGTGITKEQCAAVSSIGTIFQGNTNITKFTELKYFANYKLGRSFYGCSNLQKVDLRECIYIGAECFGNCTSLKEIGSLERVTYIGDYETFNNTQSLCIDLYLPNLEYLGSSFDCSGITNILNLGKITICNATFRNCNNLKTAVLPSTLTRITTHIFAWNTSMIWVKVMATNVPTLDGNYAFTIGGGTQYPIYVPDASVDDYKTATNWSGYASRIKPMSQFSIDFPDE